MLRVVFHHRFNGSHLLGFCDDDFTICVFRAALPGKFCDEDVDLDDLENLEEMMEGLQFDIDGFLDLDQFDFDEVALLFIYLFIYSFVLGL